MKLSLVVLTPGKSEGKLIPITLAQFVIGRDPQCHLRPASAAISKRHCAFLVREGKVFVRDFGSTNGTSVNDAPVKGEVEVKNDDKVKVGPLLFGVKIEVSAPAPVNRPTPAPAAKKTIAAPGSVVVKRPTPSPEAPRAKTPVPAGNNGSGNNDDDSIAAMLLEIQDDPNAPSSVPPGEVPEGSTVMELRVPLDGEAPSSQADKAKEDQMAKVKREQANSSAAAKAILDMYRQRPRGEAK